MSDNHPDVLEADQDGEDHPGDQKTLTPLKRPHHEKAGTDHAKEGIKDCVFDKRSNTNISALTFISKKLDILGILDNIKCCSDDCNSELNYSDIKHCGFQWNSKNRGEARPLVTHSG